MTQIKSCKNAMCEFNFMGKCGCDEVDLDASGNCIDCTIEDIYTDTETESEEE